MKTDNQTYKAYEEFVRALKGMGIPFRPTLAEYRIALSVFYYQQYIEGINNYVDMLENTARVVGKVYARPREWNVVPNTTELDPETDALMSTHEDGSDITLAENAVVTVCGKETTIQELSDNPLYTIKQYVNGAIIILNEEGKAVGQVIGSEIVMPGRDQDIPLVKAIVDSIMPAVEENESEPEVSGN